ncbi:MAG: hypothetical protein D6734_08190 [Candidatus Schekmanbacteria bacterium]|nr:MAG: hypothetical protein D6734_08190 [Candidatus Schekmanbacteria bacterium]
MITFVKLLNGLFDLIFAPFKNMAPVWGITVVSLITGVVMLIIFRYTSNQEGIKNTKEKIKGYLLEVRLFNHDLQQMLKSQKKILRTNLTYMRYSVTPMLVMIIPVIFILVQLDSRYAYRPLKEGEKTIVCLKLDDGILINNADIELELPKGLKLDAPPLRIERENEIDWRLRVEKSGNYKLTFIVNGKRYEKKLLAENILQRVGAEKEKVNFEHILLTPAETPFPSDSPIEEVRINYPEMNLTFWGVEIHWLIVFFVLSIISAFGLKDVFKVQV